MKTNQNNGGQILDTLHSSKQIGGLTHNFYRYPARMLPELARELILNFSNQGDIVLDPFMGGGTTIVEAIATGRQAIGIDINSLAAFISEAKTTPLSPRDHQIIIRWAQEVDFSGKPIFRQILEDDPRVKNFPIRARQIFGSLLEQIDLLPYPRQQHFARCCALRLGQWATDGKSTITHGERIREKFLNYVQEMLTGLNDLVIAAQKYGVLKKDLIKHRLLLHRSVIGIDNDRQLSHLVGKPTLVVTSPPYPNVHVLYHRWQVSGRRETPAPYWFIDSNDGHGASYYTCGSRSRLGHEIYFQAIKETFESIRYVINPNAMVVQLVSFYDVSKQLPAYLQTMELAGYREVFPFNADRTELWRTVPNRKWYNYVGAVHGTGKELLLFHKPHLISN